MLAQITRTLNETHAIVVDTIVELATRGEHLRRITNMTDGLVEEAVVMNERATQLARTRCCTTYCIYASALATGFLLLVSMSYFTSGKK
jgi:hypothetical protein